MTNYSQSATVVEDKRLETLEEIMSKLNTKFEVLETNQVASVKGAQRPP
jgi:hypothetical protein